MPDLVLITPPAEEPFGIEEAKLHLRVDGMDEYDLILSLITAARRIAEARTGRALLPQTWRLALPCFPDGNKPILLPRPPCTAVTAVTYLDANGASVLLDHSAYVLVQGGVQARLVPAYNTVWPTTRVFDGAVSVAFTCGYATPEDVPADIKAWMKVTLATLYDNRDAVLRGLDGTASFLPRGFVDALLDPYTVPVIA